MVRLGDSGAARGATLPSDPGSVAAPGSGQESPSPAHWTPERADTPRDVRGFMSPDRTLDFCSSLVTPESRRGSQGVAASSTPVPAESLVDLLEG
eukprot:11288826-Alexandrium_andersonii.AAC.1